jgi:hypothetical protein
VLSLILFVHMMCLVYEQVYDHQLQKMRQLIKMEEED